MLLSSRPSGHLCSRVSRRKLRIAAAKDKLPSRGFFSEADPSAEVYAKGGKKFDPEKKAGRWEKEFIWQTNWQEALELEEKQAAQRKIAKEEAEKAADEPGGGFLNLSRISDLNSLDNDVTPELLSPKRRDDIPKIELPNMTARYSYAKPTKFEARQWARGSKFSEKVVAPAPTNDEVAAQLEAQREIDQARYEQLKQEFAAWNLGLAAFTFVITYAFYTKDIAISYLLGAVGGLVYLRLLNRQVDGIGGSSLGGSVGPPRLLIPVILVLTYSRWNELFVDRSGVHLELIPMLLGFFTYKGAVIARQSLQLMNDITEQNTAPLRARQAAAEGRGEVGGAAEGGDAPKVLSIEDAMTKKILSQ